MKKVLASMSGIIFAVFGVAVLGLLMTLTYSALQRLFPDSFSNQMWGLVMFDIAAMCWAIAFVFKSETVGQYAAAGIGFAAGFIGTLGMVAAEVILSSGTATNTLQIAQWMTYGFIIVTVIHAALIYYHHAAAPDIHEKINVGVARGEIVTEAIKQATSTLEIEKAELAQNIHNDIVSQVKRDLNLYPVAGTPFEKKESAVPFLSRLAEKVGLKKQDDGPQVNSQMVWTVDANGNRHRIICMICQVEGKAWMTPDVCDHIANAKGESGGIEAVSQILKQGLPENAEG